MNDLGKDRLVEAALNGVPQITGRYATEAGFCALGVLGIREEEMGVGQFCAKYGLSMARINCLTCNRSFLHEFDLVIHMNDDHGMDFLTIARKLP